MCLTKSLTSQPHIVTATCACIYAMFDGCHLTTNCAQNTYRTTARPSMIEISTLSMLLSEFSRLQSNTGWGKTYNSIKPLGSHSCLYCILNRAGFWLILKQLRAYNAWKFTLKTNDRLELKNNHFCTRIKWHPKQLKYTIYQNINSKSAAVTIIHIRAQQRM